MNLGTTTIEADLFADFLHAYKAAKAGVPLVNTTLPSGRFLHNPAKRKVKSASDWAAEQISGTKAGADDWLKNLQNPSRDPVQAAIDAEDKWQDRLKQAIADGSRVAGLRKTSLAEISEVARNVGTGALTTGVDARKSKIGRVVNELQPLAQAVSDALQALPDKTDSDREKRLTSARKLMIGVGKTRAGRV